MKGDWKRTEKEDKRSGRVIRERKWKMKIQVQIRISIWENNRKDVEIEHKKIRKKKEKAWIQGKLKENDKSQNTDT